MPANKIFSKEFLSSKIFFIALIILGLFLFNIKYKQYQQQKSIETERNNFIKQARELEKNNLDLSQSLTYLNSDSFKEKIARQELNLKKKDEQVFNFSDNLNAAELSSLNSQEQNKPNFLKWWDYFTAQK